MSTPTIEIDSFNPYDSLLPQLKKLSIEMVLILIKTLRAKGYDIIKPQDSMDLLKNLLERCNKLFLQTQADQVIVSISSRNNFSGLITNEDSKAILIKERIE